MRTLVIGGTRFIGRAAVAELLRRGHDVAIFHRGRSPNPFGERVRERLGDRLKPRSVRKVLRGERFDAVVDIAYAWNRGTGPREVSFVADAVRDGLARYVFLSSAAVYGGGPQPFAEDSPRETAWGAYGNDKIGAEDYLMSEHRSSRLVVSIVRPPFVYGPWNDIPREAWFWDRILAGRPVIVPDRGETLLHWAAARDVAWALAECVENPEAAGEVFNVAEDAPIPQAAYVDRLAHVAARSIEKAFVPRSRIRELGGRVFRPPFYFAVALDIAADFSIDISKARDRLGFMPTDPIEGLRDAYAWYEREDRGRTPRFSFDQKILGR